MTAHLDREMLAAFKTMTLDDGQRLEALGVPRNRWIDLHDAELIGIAPISHAAGDLYEPADEGRPHVIIGITETAWSPDPDDRPEAYAALIDLVAFDPAKPGQWYLRTGAAWALGIDDIRRSQIPAAPHESTVRMTSNPIEWLRVGGACVLDWSGEAVAELRHCTAFEVARETFAQTIHSRLLKPPRLPKVTVIGEIRRAA